MGTKTRMNHWMIRSLTLGPLTLAVGAACCAPPAWSAVVRAAQVPAVRAAQHSIIDPGPAPEAPRAYFPAGMNSASIPWQTPTGRQGVPSAPGAPSSPETPTALAAALGLVSALGLASIPALAAAPGPTANSAQAPTPDPDAANSTAPGKGLAACAVGQCEVTVRAGDTIPVPAATRVKSLRVTGIDERAVTLTGQDIGHSHTVLCLTFCTVSAANDGFSIELQQSGEAYENRLHVTLVSRTTDTAVLRLSEAPERSLGSGNVVLWHWPLGGVAVKDRP